MGGGLSKIHLPFNNKKVLLRERKRHTDHSISSTPYAVLSGGLVPWLGGGQVPWGTPSPHPNLDGDVGTLGGGVGTLGYPHLDLDVGG